MIGLPLERCLGIDTRPAWAGGDRFVLETGSNIQVMPSGYVQNRPAVVKFADVSSSSFGLYSRGSYLRCLVAGGNSLQDDAPTGIVFDGIGNGGTTDYLGKIGAVLAAETFGTSQVYGPHGYVAIRRSDNNQIEHHFIQEPPANIASHVSTKVTLPFQPGRALIKIANKIVASDPASGYFRYCSTVNGPTDWTTTGDAGFEAAQQFVAGARELVGFGIHRGMLAVFYTDGVQLWQMSEDPADIALEQVLNGPGTEHALSIANVLGDAYFLSRSGFSSLSTAQTVAGEALYGDIGDKIATLSASIASTDTVISLWSQKRSQFLAFVGSTVYVFSLYPLSSESAWTTWTLPITVEAAVEHGGVVYLRASNVIYKLDDTTGTDYNGTAIAGSFQTRPFSFYPAVGRLKSLRRMTMQSTGRITATPIVDGRTLTANATTFPASSSPVPGSIAGSGRRIAFGFTTSGAFRMDGALIEAEGAGV